MNSYKTVAGNGTAEISEKKSRFIAHVSPVGTEEEASAFIAKVRKTHYNATHNVFAYSIGELVKASDDGEPSGTAGLPILDILRKERITYCVIVVTRYFGGTLLGTGGLVRAYSKAAKEGLNAAKVIERVLCVKYELTVDYHTYGKVQYELDKERFKTEEIKYTDNVTFVMVIEETRCDDFLKLVSKYCAGRETLIEIETGYYNMQTQAVTE